MPNVTITPEALAKSAALYRKELLQMPVLALGPALNYFTLRTGIRYSETVGQLAGAIEMGPYSESRVDSTGVSVAGRTLRTYFGSVIKEFSPNSVAQSIYGSSITSGEGLKDTDIVRQVLAFLSAKIGQGFAQHLFDAVRNDSGTKTVDLFDGIDTITGKEITAGNIAVAKGNLYEFSEAITSDNAVDSIVAFCRAASDELLDYEDGADSQGGQLNLFVPRSLVYAYRDDYKTTTGQSPIYDKFNQTVVEGFPNITLVPMAGKAKSDYIQLSSKANMLIGTDQMSNFENIVVEKHAAFVLQFVATMFFGVDFESVSPERLLVGKFKAATPPTDDQGGKTGN